VLLSSASCGVVRCRALKSTFKANKRRQLGGPVVYILCLMSNSTGHVFMCLFAAFVGAEPGVGLDLLSVGTRFGGFGGRSREISLSHPNLELSVGPGVRILVIWKPISIANLSCG
jgi:hypothetical protein